MDKPQLGIGRDNPPVSRERQLGATTHRVSRQAGDYEQGQLFEQVAEFGPAIGQGLPRLVQLLPLANRCAGAEHTIGPGQHQ